MGAVCVLHVAMPMAADSPSSLASHQNILSSRPLQAQRSRCLDRGGFLLLPDKCNLPIDHECQELGLARVDCEPALRFSPVARLLT